MRITLRYKVKVFCALLCYVMCLPSAYAESPSSEKRFVTLRQGVPWDPEGQNYESYDAFKDDLILAMRTAIKRIVIATQYISDNDILAALYSARARGIKVSVILDRQANFGGRRRVPPRVVQVVYKDLEDFDMEGDTTLVIDRSVWRLNVSLDVNTEEGVRIDRSPYTAPEVESWIKPGQPVQAAPEQPPATSANPSTSPTQPKLRIFGNIKKSNPPVVQGTVPRSLPRETKWQKLKRGVDTELLDGSAPGTQKTPSLVPGPSSRESDLTE